MADKQTTVALNIGSQRISMAVFEVDKSGGLVLKAYDSEAIAADPAMDTARIAQTRLAISDLTQRMGLAKSKARYAISGQAVFIRFVKLPPIQQDDIEQLVTFEAQQHVPFPLEEVIWDYELIEGAVDKEAVIVAIKSDALDEINSAVNDGGIGTCEVDVAPMAVYNAYRASYPVSEEPVLIIDIGAKTSNLIYIEGKRFFTRSIPIGGVAITSAIAKEYNVSFLEAERQKVVNGLVALGGGHTEQLDESVAALAMVIRNSLSRLPAEIARTTNYYRSQHGGSAPRKVLLAGGGANLPYTLEFFHEKLNLPIEFFNPVRNLMLAKDIDPLRVQKDGHTMGELIGLALRGIGQSDIHIDLVPSIVEQARADERRKPMLVAAAALLVGGMGAWAVCQNTAATEAEKFAQTMQERRESLAPHYAGITKLLQKEKQAQQIASAYIGLQANQVFWHEVLAELRGAFASDAVWLTDMDPITGFDPGRLVASSPDPKAGANGQAVVATDFEQIEYSQSSLAKLKDIAPAAGGAKPKGKNKKVAAEEPMIDAVRIRGYWRENPRSQNLVSDLLKQLQDHSVVFDFVVEAEDPANPKKKISINLADDQHISKIMSVASEPLTREDLAQPFEITLPLARKVAIK